MSLGITEPSYNIFLILDDPSDTDDRVIDESLGIV